MAGLKRLNYQLVCSQANSGESMIQGIETQICSTFEQLVDAGDCLHVQL